MVGEQTLGEGTSHVQNRISANLGVLNEVCFGNYIKIACGFCGYNRTAGSLNLFTNTNFIDLVNSSKNRKRSNRPFCLGPSRSSTISEATTSEWKTISEGLNQGLRCQVKQVMNMLILNWNVLTENFLMWIMGLRTLLIANLAISILNELDHIVVAKSCIFMKNEPTKNRMA